MVKRGNAGGGGRKRRHGGSRQAPDNRDDQGVGISTIKQVGGALLVALLSAGIGAQYYSDPARDSAASPSTSSSSAAATLDNPQLAALVRHDESWNRTDPTLQNIHTYLSTYVCRHPKGYCHPNLQPVPSRRTHRTSDGISAGTVILKLPRELQIWDLDAMRDDFVRRELLQARHGGTGNPLDSGAYLAAYLIRRRRVAEGEWKQTVAEDGEVASAAVDDPMLQYLQILPTYDDLSQSHPTLWSDSDLWKQLGRDTPSAVLVQAFRDMMESEYDALCAASKEFASNVPKEDYFAARINVMSRSFGPGSPSHSEEDVSRFGSMDLELSNYKEKAGIDLTLGCRAMSPILDTWDSHPHPNAEWNYDAKSRAFVVWASDRWGGIPAYHDVMVSYGKYSDAFLFAKFGYVNGDGTSHTETYVNAHHRLLDVGLMQQFSYLSWSGHDSSTDDALGNQNKELLHYLAFDDGYEECIRSSDGSNNPGAWTLKQLKFRMLQKIANRRDRWVMQVSPRRGKNQGPGFSSAVQNSPTSPPIFDVRKMRFDVSKLVATCRLITLTDEDYDGQAQSILADALTKGGEFVESFMVEKQSDALEYRAASCIGRLVDIMLRRYPSSVTKDFDALSKSSTAASEEASAAIQYGSKQWYATNVRLGEMQSLEILGGSMMQHARRLRSGMGAPSADGAAALIVRRKPCPIEYSLPLLELET